MSHEPWALAFTAATEAEAAVVAGFLESQGIPVAIESRSFRQEPVTFGALVQIRVLVPPDQADAAREMLDERDRRFVLLQPGNAADDAADENLEDEPISDDEPNGEPPGPAEPPETPEIDGR